MLFFLILLIACLATAQNVSGTVSTVIVNTATIPQPLPGRDTTKTLAVNWIQETDGGLWTVYSDGQFVPRYFVNNVQVGGLPASTTVSQLQSVHSAFIGGVFHVEFRSGNLYTDVYVVQDTTSYGFIGVNVVPFGDTIPGIDDCWQYNAQQCLSGNFAATSSCRYDYGSQHCTTGVSPDVCQASTTQSSCNTNSCFWDQYTNSCFASLAQVNYVYGCNIWSSSIAPDGTNPACSYHGCAYDSPSRTCADVTQEGSTTDGRTTTSYSSKVTFEDPQVLPNSNTFQVQLIVPYVWDTQATVQPKYPIVDVLFPVTGVESYVTSAVPACSTFTTDNYAEPEQFSTNASPTDVNAFLQQWIIDNSNLTFDTSAIGQVLTKSLGNPSIGASSIVKSVSYASNQFNYTIQMDLTAVVAGCASQGASVVNNADGAVYQIPISYIEHATNGLYTQTTVYYQIAILLTGQVTIAATATYKERAFPLEIIYPKNGCEANEARQQVSSKHTNVTCAGL
jgi:hypothetical protein